MKRKGSKKVQKADESNGIEDAELSENENASENEEVEEPQTKKKKAAKASKRNVSFSKKDSENDEDEGKTSKKKKDSKAKEESENGGENEDDQDEEKSPKKKKGRPSKVKDASEDDSEGDNEGDDQDEDDDTQYEVEKILDEKLLEGVRYYLIRWKGYGEESDTWEAGDTLNCKDLIKKYRSSKTTKKKTKETDKKPEKKKKTKPSIPEQDWDENEDFEVDRILEVHHKRDGKREFLVSWKGYSSKDSSWEPEENMNCKDLIAKFMEKVDIAKNVDEKDLRVNRKHVQRLTYNTPEAHRRLSKRNSGKERVQYHDAE